MIKKDYAGDKREERERSRKREQEVKGLIIEIDERATTRVALPFSG